MIKSFRAWLESVETGGSFVGITGIYINPDRFWQRAFDETFVFCDNKLYTYEMSPELDRVCTHHEFFYHIPELKKKIAEHLKKDIDDVGIIDAANYRIGQSEKDCLIGRFFTNNNPIKSNAEYKYPILNYLKCSNRYIKFHQNK